MRRPSRRLAGPAASADVDDLAAARHRRSKTIRDFTDGVQGLERLRLLSAHRRRHHRGRARHMEQLEGPAPALLFKARKRNCLKAERRKKDRGDPGPCSPPGLGREPLPAPFPALRFTGGRAADVLERNARLIDRVDRDPAKAKPSSSRSWERGATWSTSIPGRRASSTGSPARSTWPGQHHRCAITPPTTTWRSQFPGQGVGRPDHRAAAAERGSGRGHGRWTQGAFDRALAAGAAARGREAFSVQPAAFLDNNASSRYTVVEVNARDRALLFELARALYLARPSSQRPCRHPWRTRRRRLLPDRSQGREDQPATQAIEAALLRRRAASRAKFSGA